MDVDNKFTADVLKRLYWHKKFTDFEIRAGNKRVSCHRAVISAKSQYFDSICASGFHEAVLDLASDGHGYILEAVVKFMYLGETNVTVYNVESLLLAADFIKHADLIRYCERFMIENLSLVNFMDYLKLAKTVSLPSLEDVCVRLTKEKCSDALLTDWFLSLSVEEICEYLNDDELNMTNEDEVLAAVQRWLRCTKASANVKDGYIQSVFPCIRLQFCSRTTLESLSRDEAAPKLMKLKIQEFLHHGLHREGSARKSYSKAQGATGASVSTSSDTSASASAPAIGARRKVPMPTHQTPKPDAQEHVPIVGGVKANNEVHKNILFLDKEGEDSILTEAPLCVHSCRGATAASASTSVSASAPAIGARSKVPKPAHQRPKPDTQEHVLIVGGKKANNELHKNIVFLDKEGEDSILTEAPLCVHSGCCSVCTTGDGLIVSGGYNRVTKLSMSKVQIFSLADRAWSDLPDMLHPSMAHGVAFLDNHFYAFGGCHWKDGKTKHLYSDVNVLDLQSLSWSHCKPLPYAVKEPGVAVVGQDILVIGGFGKDGSMLTKTYMYNGRTRKRTRCQDMPEPNVVFRCTVVIGSLVYAFSPKAFLLYDVHNDQWSKLPLPPPMELRQSSAMVHTQGCLLAQGGCVEDQYHPDDTVLSYNLASKKWTHRTEKMPLAVGQAWAFTVLM